VPVRLAPLDDRGDMRAPCRERSALLVRPCVTLIDADDARPASRDVVQNGFGHFEPDAQPLKAGGHRAAKVMQAPIFDAAGLVQGRLCLAEAVEGSATAGEYWIGSLVAWCGAQDRLRLRR